MANLGYLNGPLSTLGTQAEFRAVNFQQLTNSSITTTVSGRTVRVANSTTLWGGTLEFTTYTQYAFKYLQGFFAKTRGALNDFYIQIPGVSDFQGTYTGTPSLQVVTTTSAGNNEVDIITTAGTINLRTGDMIQFESHSKVYMITDDCTGLSTSAEDSAGGKTLKFEPNLVEAVTAGNFVNFSNVPFRVVCTNDEFTYNYNLDGTVDFAIEVREVI